MSINLQYSYAYIESTGLCVTCMTFSYEINDPQWIAVPYASDDYIGKYYNVEDGLWYYDQEFTEIYNHEA